MEDKRGINLRGKRKIFKKKIKRQKSEIEGKVKLKAKKRNRKKGIIQIDERRKQRRN